jgi:hypothetical protein
LEGQVVEPGSGRVEVVPGVRWVVIDSQAERGVGWAEHDCVATGVAAIVPLLELALEAEHSFVRGGAGLGIGDRDADMVGLG